jgi:hypothetical protein
VKGIGTVPEGMADDEADIDGVGPEDPKDGTAELPLD